ncbi:hypothetical protein CRE_23194 [Caenorhabditis remanei]|uniref:F-box domain-containing protein n=1 Tax=Caenorhabditis remanei TaxID=31234 RepID=E3NLD0_CAERE|nr:hypothetical protein CRE_23194 [Caenorhabditis remanei]
MSSPFPLLRLPRVFLFDVFLSLSIGEKIKLSLCSKKISTQINNARLYSQKVIVDLGRLCQKIEVSSENSKDAFKIFIPFNTGKITDIDIQQCRIEGVTVPVTTKPAKIITFWKNHPKGLLSVIRHLLKMFQCKISADISIYNSDLYQSIASELFDLQPEFKTLTIEFVGLKQHNLLFNQISSNFGLVQDLRIFSDGNLDFRPVFASWPQNIDIMNSVWFTLEYFLGCTCTTITLFHSNLENKDLDEILKNWKAGRFPNLEYLLVDSQFITNNETTILGMSLLELHGKDIQTDDGSKKATIRSRGQWIVISATKIE